MTRLLVLLFGAVLLLLAASVGLVMVGESPPVLGPLLADVLNPTDPINPADTAPRVYTVPRGSTARDIGEDLQARGLIRSGMAFRFVVEQEGVGSALTAGDYELNPSMSTREIVQVLAKGQTKRGIILTIPEGWRVEQIADRAEAVGFASRQEFLAAVADPRSIPGVERLWGTPTLEGYLFPETYEVRAKVSGSQAAELMVAMFDRRVADLLRRAGDRTDSEPRLTPHQLLTVASIVEREARQPDERSTIASVYLNRLVRGMPLQADPTVQYAVANRDLQGAKSYGYWKQDLTVPNLRLDSPFNTYVVRALPPAPICNPGEASIKAVLEPAKSDYLYFVAKSDGSGNHLFARTLAEHNANVARESK